MLINESLNRINQINAESFFIMLVKKSRILSLMKLIMENKSINKVSTNVIYYYQKIWRKLQDLMK